MRWKTIVVGIVIVAGVAMAWNAYFDQHARPTAQEARFSELREASLAACHCKREGGDDEACDAEYLEAREFVLDQVYGEDRSSYEGAALSACGGVSEETECFRFADGSQCITRYSSPATICNRAEANAYTTALANGNPDAAENILRLINDGGQLTQFPMDEGCN